MDDLRNIRGMFYKEYRISQRKAPPRKIQRLESSKTYCNESCSSVEIYFNEEVHQETPVADEDEKAVDDEVDEEIDKREQLDIDDEERLDLRTEDDYYRNEKLSMYLKPGVWEDLSPYQSFDICDFVRERIQSEDLRLRSCLSSSNKTVMFEGSEVQIDVFKCAYQRLITSNSLTAKGAAEVLDLIRLVLPKGNNLPQSIGCTFDDIESESTQSKCISVLEMQSCDCGSTIYVGDYRNSTACPTCNSGRFTRGDNRYPVSLMNYRSVILIVFELLQTAEFYNTIRDTNFADFRDNAHVDVMDGDVAKRHYDEMESNFSTYQSQSNDLSILPLNLLFCLQYDGAQVFHHSVTNFWPLLLTILNLPPNLRKEVGVGTFMIALFTAYSNSLCENFLFKKLLVPELQQLCQGYIMTVRGNRFYVQARLLLHCYDSKALESVVKVQGTNSLAGCSLCRLAPG